MDVSFACPECMAKLKFDAATYPPGLEVDCPDCGSHISIPRPELGPGVTIGGFELLRLLGKGGMGEVYLARQISMDREVAVKILPASFGLREENVRRFRQEVKLAARLKESHIVRAHEAGEDLGVHFLAMEYVEGHTIADRLGEHGPIPETEARELVEKIGRALAQLWKKHRMIHRDIKPANIMLDEDGEPQLMDLGVSKALDDGPGMTASTDITGTPNYMSPEQVMGSADIDFRTDMYSLGATLYHMLTARVPFQGSSVLNVLHKQTTEELPDPREINPTISAGMAAILTRMMAKQPEARFGSWDEFLLALNAPIQAPPEVTASQRPRVLLLGAGLVVAVIAALGFFLRSQPEETADGPADLQRGLIARWNFEGNGPEALDSSGHERHGTILARNASRARTTNAPPVALAGQSSLKFLRYQRKSKVAIHFDPPLELRAGISVAAWVFLEAAEEDVLEHRPILRTVNQKTQHLRLMSDGRFRVLGGNDWMEFDSISPGRLPRNLWYHLAATHDGKRTRVYLNAERVHDRSRNHPPTVNLKDLELADFRMRSPQTAIAIDDVRLYDRALNLREIRILAGLLPPESPTRRSAHSQPSR